jgi:ubiquinone/menaquinone biosynthesis C-methylase UbiE
MKQVRMMEHDILQEQIAYYRARAQEYDESLYLTGRFANEEKDENLEREFALIDEALRAHPPVQSVLELACGTGIWTQALLAVGQSITAVDASPEMLDINRKKIASPRVRYVCADLFEWKPDRQYDLVMFAFWLSHVPPDRLDSFLERVCRAVRPGGSIFMADEPAKGSDDGIYQPRKLHNGQEFTIVKVYYNPASIQNKLVQHGFTAVIQYTGSYFFYLSGKRNQE